MSKGKAILWIIFLNVLYAIFVVTWGIISHKLELEDPLWSIAMIIFNILFFSGYIVRLYKILGSYSMHERANAKIISRMIELASQADNKENFDKIMNQLTENFGEDVVREEIIISQIEHMAAAIIFTDDEPQEDQNKEDPTLRHPVN